MVNYCKQILWNMHSFRRFILSSKNSYNVVLPQINAATSKSFHTTSVNRLVLSPQEINDILRENEFSADLSNGPVKSYETNQLAANSPIEDYTSEVQCKLTTGYLFGVFDGHGGKSCAYVTSKRLFHYLAASLLPEEALNTHISSTNRAPLIEYFDVNKAKMQFVPDLNNLYANSFDKFLKDLAVYTEETPYSLEHMIEYTFNYFDNNLSTEFLKSYNDKEKTVDPRLLNIAISGAVACVAYVDGQHLHIANTGDCCAVMGSVTEDNDWVTKKLSLQHCAENQKELKRVYDEHKEERDTVVKADRLLGQLLPLRAFGDFRYKWDKKIMEDLVVPSVGNIIPEHYLSPPYLSAIPEIFTYKLTPRDRFVVLATDGLWDVFSPQEVVTLVGEHMLGKASFTPVQFINRTVTLGEVKEILDERRASLEIKPIDRNAATHLIRHAFGSTDSGIISNSKLSKLLSMPPKKARRFRDDISITIIYFDGEYLRNQPE